MKNEIILKIVSFLGVVLHPDVGSKDVSASVC